MREIKFRVWSESEQRYIYGLSRYLFGSDDNEKCTLYIPQDFKAIFEQYTGLKDKNGREIYEGDILGGIYEHGYIAYCDKCKQLQFFDADMGCMMCSGDIYWRDIVESERDGELVGELEVIGNIHENPELFKKEK